MKASGTLRAHCFVLLAGETEGSLKIATSLRQHRDPRMARTKKNKPGGARRQKEAAPKAKQAPPSVEPAKGGRPDAERPAKKQRLEQGAGHAPSKPSNASHDARDTEQEPGEQRGKTATPKKGPDSTAAVPTRPKPNRRPTRPAEPPPTSLHPQSPHPATAVEQLEQPSLRTDLASSLSKTHDVISLSIISSSQIQKKVSRVLSHISSLITRKPPLAILTAKAGVASKAIAIAEISKREIGNGGGVWFQYSGVEGVLGEWVPKERRTKGEGEKVETKSEGAEDGEKAIEPKVPANDMAEATKEEVDRGGEEEEEEAFETMRNPPVTNPKAQEHPSIIELELGKKIRAVPVLTIYLSRAQVGELKKEYGYVTSPYPQAHRSEMLPHC